jgi:hypothetical protein
VPHGPCAAVADRFCARLGNGARLGASARRILVVDDNVDAAESFADLLIPWS